MRPIDSAAPPRNLRDLATVLAANAPALFSLCVMRSVGAACARLATRCVIGRGRARTVVDRVVRVVGGLRVWALLGLVGALGVETVRAHTYYVALDACGTCLAPRVQGLACAIALVCVATVDGVAASVCALATLRAVSQLATSSVPLAVATVAVVARRTTWAARSAFVALSCTASVLCAHALVCASSVDDLDEAVSVVLFFGAAVGAAGACRWCCGRVRANLPFSTSPL